MAGSSETLQPAWIIILILFLRLSDKAFCFCVNAAENCEGPLKRDAEMTHCSLTTKMQLSCDGTPVTGCLQVTFRSLWLWERKHTRNVENVREVFAPNLLTTNSRLKCAILKAEYAKDKMRFASSPAGKIQSLRLCIGCCFWKTVAGVLLV